MAIRPVDLQLAYLATPQNAALISSAQDAPQAAQQAAQAAFAAQVAEREEHVDEVAESQGGKVTRRQEREPADQRRPSHGRERHPGQDEEQPRGGALGLAGEGEHFIDVTA